MTSDFDAKLKQVFVQREWADAELTMPKDLLRRYEYDFCIANRNGTTLTVEVEKANREKILRDILKAHIYLKHGANFVLIVLPKNYPHRHGCIDLFQFGKERHAECTEYGFGNSMKQIALLGFRQKDQKGRSLNREWRNAIRRRPATR